MWLMTRGAVASQLGKNRYCCLPLPVEKKMGRRWSPCVGKVALNIFLCSFEQVDLRRLILIGRA